MKEKSKNKMRHKPSVLSVSGIVVLSIFSIFLVAILVWALIFSFADYRSDILNASSTSAKHFLVFPSKINFNNYTQMFSRFYIDVFNERANRLERMFLPQMLLNSLYYAIGQGISGALAPCLVAYATYFYKSKFNKVIDTIVIVTMILPIVGALPSQMKLIYSIGFNDSIPALWIMGFSFANLNYFIFKAAFSSVPKALSEAATIDGASNFRVFATIVLPLISTTFLAIALVSFINTWNNYATFLAFAPNKPSAAYGLLKLVGNSSGVSEPTLKMAGAMLLLLPILILYLLVNKFLMGNLTMGGVKG